MTHRLRMVDPAAMHARTAAATLRAVDEVLQSGAWVGGDTVRHAEQALAKVLGARHAVSTSSGTSALQLTLHALGIGPGDDVVVPAVSFVATATAVMRTGARPVVVDVLPGMPLLDSQAVAEALTPRVRAVVSVSLFGNRPPDLHLPEGVAWIEDAAQAVGAVGRVAGPLARTASFYPTKVLAAAGDGGLVATDDPQLAARVRSLGFHGRSPTGEFGRVEGVVAGNDRLDAIQAAILLARLPDLAPRVAHRRKLLRRYRARLPHLILPHDPHTNAAVVAAVHPERDHLRAALAARGIDTACYYPRPMSAEPVLAGALVPQPIPRAEQFCAQCFALPCHIGLTPAHIDHICDVLQELLP